VRYDSQPHQDNFQHETRTDLAFVERSAEIEGEGASLRTTLVTGFRVRFATPLVGELIRYGTPDANAVPSPTLWAYSARMRGGKQMLWS
jgi:hypothetical protein